MEQGNGQIASGQEGWPRQPQLVAEDGQDGAGLPAIAPGKPAQSRPQPRRLGARAAANRALALRAGLKDPSPDKEAMLAVLGRLLVLYENATGKLFAEGEETQAGEPRVLLSKTLPDLFDRIDRGLRYVFHDNEGAAW